MILACIYGQLGGVLPADGASRVSQATAVVTSPVTASAGTPPLFAYFYQWFDPSSWNRAKLDYPLLGRYSSDDVGVMRQQVEWAKRAGVTGFIVSWKDTPVNDRRLRELMGVALSEKFALAMIYQGLDFSRHPLPIKKVAADFVTFRDKFAASPVFYRVGGKPLTIWSGTWAYSQSAVAAVTGPVRMSMLVLSSEKSLAGYQRLSGVTDGDAYYWSSVNPATNAGYSAKLVAMSDAIHADRKYWIAPFAAGFDARLVGGSKTVNRNGGATMRTEYGAALRSSPDALGLISWNEFSENTYVEPSKRYGDLYLKVLTEIRLARLPIPRVFADSSDSSIAANASGRWINVGSIASFAVVLFGGVMLAGRRRRRSKGRRDSPTRRRRYVSRKL